MRRVTSRFPGFMDLMERRYEPAIASFLETMRRDGPNGAICSALAQAYEQIAFADPGRPGAAIGSELPGQSLDVSRRRGRRAPAANSIRRLLERESDEALFPILVEKTSVRLDLSHSGWSDIFFLGMDFPEGARVLNISVDLGVHGRDQAPTPPIEARLRVITEPILRLTSIDLNACKDVDSLEELFNFGNDYLGLIKAAVVASGLIPPALEGTHTRLAELLGRVVRDGHGLEIVSKVNDIPKGSRLAVSTNLLASLITLLMRATGQARNLTGPLDPEEAKVVVARAILGEWMGGSGGGWQDSGGIFPGIKLIEGVAAAAGDPEWGISRGRLLPAHTPSEHAEPARSSTVTGAAGHRSLPDGPRQKPGAGSRRDGAKRRPDPQYGHRQVPAARAATNGDARVDALEIFEQILASVRSSDVRGLGSLTTQNWDGPLKRIIPWVTNAFTESIIARRARALGDDFWGFLMLGGMSGGGMAFFVAPHRHDEFQAQIAAIMKEAKSSLDDALPFAMEPVVYDFRINAHGTFATLDAGTQAMMPPAYYTLQVPRMIAAGTSGASLSSPGRRRPLRQPLPGHRRSFCAFSARPSIISSRSRGRPTMSRGPNGTLRPPRSAATTASTRSSTNNCATTSQRGRIGLARNRLPVDLDIRDVDDSELIHATAVVSPSAISRGESAMRARRGRRRDACRRRRQPMDDRRRRRQGRQSVRQPRRPAPQLPGDPSRQDPQGPARVQDQDSPHRDHELPDAFRHRTPSRHPRATTATTARSTSRAADRSASDLIPMTRDLSFLWEEASHETLDDNKQKVRDAGRRAILDWAKSQGEGTDYTDNLPIQRFNPPGHFHEVPNLLRNGVLAQLLDEYPNLQWLLVHNIDTLGAFVEPAVLGLVIESAATLSFEVIPRRIDDRGGGLAKVAGRVRLLEGLAQPREDTEFKLRYYNTLTTWVQIDGLLEAFGLTREALKHDPRASRQRGPRHGGPRADLRDNQGRQAPVGPRAGRRLSDRPVRETLGRHELAPRLELFVPGRRSPPRPAAQRHRPARRLGQRRQPGARAVALRVRTMSDIQSRTGIRDCVVASPRRARTMTDGADRPLLILTCGGRRRPSTLAVRTRRQPDAWYRGSEGARVAANIRSHQSRRRRLAQERRQLGGAVTMAIRAKIKGTFDNGATVGELRFLARAFRAAGDHEGSRRLSQRARPHLGRPVSHRRLAAVIAAR